jgi:hypothetical protein
MVLCYNNGMVGLVLYDLMRPFLTQLNANATIQYDGDNCLFVARKATEQELAECRTAVTNKVVAHKGVLKIFSDSDKILHLARKAFDNCGRVESYGRVTFRHPLEKLPDNEPSGSSDVPFHTVGIDRPANQCQDFVNSDLLLDEIEGTWHSIKAFDADGFGSIATHKREIVGWCLSEHNHSEMCGIGIETIEQYQNRGIGTSMVHYFLSICAERKVTPLWDSWDWSTPSVRLAIKAGFEKVQEYRALFLSF